jgi:hypothetical protein
MEGQAPQHPPGWYPNPQGPGQRYWDGTKWTDQYQPGAPVQEDKKRGRFGRNCLMVTLGVVIGGVVLIGGCVAILGSALDEAEDEQNETAITLQEFRSTPIGSSRQEVRRRLGTPGDVQEFENEGLPGSAVRSSCIYYNEQDKGLGEGRYFQFCFDNGRLTGKNAY